MFNMRVMLSVAALAAAIMPGPGEIAPGFEGSDLRPSRRGRRGKGQDTRRGKGVVARPKRRSNRLTISKRVRRKHRRPRKAA